MASHQLIVGGQRSGKSGQAERLALAAAEAGATVTVLATALALDDEMRARIAHHQHTRPAGFNTVETTLALAQGLFNIASTAGRLVVIDCLTLWLTNWLMPMNGKPDLPGWEAERQALLDVLPGLASPVIFISNEVGWGISPMTREARFFVDELGRLNQAVALRCASLTLMVAGQAWTRDVDARAGNKE